MSYFFPEGSKFQFSTTLASAKNVTVATNANPAVATAVAHGYTTDDEFLYTSGWEDATNSIYRANVLTVDTLGVKGLDTSNTSFFAAGSGLGTLQKISGWTDIPQVLGISTSGGDARFTTIQPLSSRNAINVPTGFNPTTINLTIGHDPNLAAIQTLLGISRTLSKVAFKMILSGGGVTYGYGYINVSESPNLSTGQANQVNASFTLLGRSISY
jgi:hypothetical protein